MNDIVRMFNQVEIRQRADGYLNATAMCKANEKDWFDYFRLETTRAFLAELSANIGYPVENRQTGKSRFVEYQSLIVTKRGGKEPGTWVHPQVAYHLAQWCSPVFAVQVSAWIHDIATKGFATAPGVSIDLDRLTGVLQAFERAMPAMAGLAEKVSAVVQDLDGVKAEVAELRACRDVRISVQDRVTTYDIAALLNIPVKGRGSTIPSMRRSLIAFANLSNIPIVSRPDTRRPEETFPIPMITDWRRLCWEPMQAERKCKERSDAIGQGALDFKVALINRRSEHRSKQNAPEATL